jgi:hypothetical protein
MVEVVAAFLVPAVTDDDNHESQHPEHANLIDGSWRSPRNAFDQADVSFLTHQQIDALLDAVDRSRWVGRRDHTLLTLTIQTGLRVSELVGLRCQDLQLTILLQPAPRPTGLELTSSTGDNGPLMQLGRLDVDVHPVAAPQRRARDVEVRSFGLHVEHVGVDLPELGLSACSAVPRAVGTWIYTASRTPHLRAGVGRERRVSDSLPFVDVVVHIEDPRPVLLALGELLRIGPAEHASVHDRPVGAVLGPVADLLLEQLRQPFAARVVSCLFVVLVDLDSVRSIEV